MNDAELEHVVDALQRLIGTWVTGAWQPRRDRVILGLGSERLLLVPRGPFARLHTVQRKPRNPGNPFSFQGAVRAHVHGPLRDIRKHPSDRVVELVFSEHTLCLRMTGRSGGLWILKGDTVLAAYDGPAPDALPELPEAPSAPMHATPRFSPEGAEDWDAAAARWFGRREADYRRQERRRLIRRRLKARLKREGRLRQALDGDLDKADTAPAARARADAVAARLHTVKRGQAQVEVPDLDDPSVTWTVALDPKRSPGENLERLYSRARRLERMGDRVLEHIDRVERRIAALESALEVVDEADDALLRELESLAPSEKRGRTRPSDEPWITWVGPSGQEVLVGRNARANRRLTFQRARGDDIWMHIRGRPGAHLLVPTRKGGSQDLEVLLAAAQIALVHAKVGEGDDADVQYTRAKNVRSIKGAEDGRVMVLDERVLHVRRDPSQLVGWRRRDADHFDADALESAVRPGAGQA